MLSGLGRAMTTVEHPRDPKVLLVADTRAEGLPTLPKIRQLLVAHIEKGGRTAATRWVGVQSLF